MVDIAENHEPKATGRAGHNKTQLDRETEQLKVIPSGTAWLNIGIWKALSGVPKLVGILESRQGQMMRTPIEIGSRQGFLTNGDLPLRSEPELKSRYGAYPDERLD